MLCKQCKKNKIDKFINLKICNSCYSKNYRKLHPEKYFYKYSGMKQKVFKRDGYKCVLCGEIKKEKLLIHHLDGNGRSKNGKILKVREQNNNFSNLITLCFSCHGKVHRISEWSRRYDKCIKCGTTEIAHYAKGICKKCYMDNYEKKYYEKNRENIKKRKANWFQRRGKILEKLKRNERA